MYIKKFKEIKAFLRRSKEARFKRYLDLYGDNSLSFGKKLLGYFNYNFLWKLKPLVHSRKKLILGKKIMFLLDVQKRIGWKCVVVSVVMYKKEASKVNFQVLRKSQSRYELFLYFKTSIMHQNIVTTFIICYLAACKRYRIHFKQRQHVWQREEMFDIFIFILWIMRDLKKHNFVFSPFHVICAYTHQARHLCLEECLGPWFVAAKFLSN